MFVFHYGIWMMVLLLANGLLLLTSFLRMGHATFGLHLNLAKCEIYWPSAFPEFPVAVCREGIISGDVELLSCPPWES